MHKKTTHYTLKPSIKLYDWQTECLNTWEQHGGRGTVDVVTGAGKTIFAIAAFCRCSQLSSCPLRIRIVLPKHSLIRQWADAIHSSVQETVKIGEWHGKRKDSTDCDVMIYIVNSARHTISSHILKDQADGFSTFLIADECHHYCSTENLKIFHFLHSADFNPKHFYAVGLSATSDKGSSIKEMNVALGECIYSYGITDALHDKHISPFSLFGIQIDLSIRENTQYMIIETKIARLLSQLRKKYPEVAQLPIGVIMKKLQGMTGDLRAKDFFDQLDDLLRKKQTIIVMAAARIPCVLHLIKELSPDVRILIFCERIRQAKLLYQEISYSITSRVALYHSELSEEVRKISLHNFKHGEARILISCRALDEGIDVPDCDAGIILSSSSSQRQHIQRLGRILRTSPGKQMASVYYIYAKDKEDASYLSDQDASYTRCNLKYLLPEDTFIHPAFEEYALDVLHDQKNTATQQQLAELRACLIEGYLKTDYLMDYEILQEKMHQETDRHMKNYWYACLLMHQKIWSEI